MVHLKLHHKATPVSKNAEGRFKKPTVQGEGEGGGNNEGGKEGKVRRKRMLEEEGRVDGLPHMVIPERGMAMRSVITNSQSSFSFHSYLSHIHQSSG